MSAIVVIGDELDCAGFRLAGVQTHSPAADAVAQVFTQALETASLVVLTRRCADTLAPGVLARAMARETPLVVVVPDVTAPRADTGWARRIRGVLGIGA